MINNIKRKINKQILVNTFGGKCQICGFSECLEALEFHHRNPENKKFNISKIAGKNDYSYEDIQELTKCVLLCSNCHRNVGKLKDKLDEIEPIDILDFLF